MVNLLFIEGIWVLIKLEGSFPNTFFQGVQTPNTNCHPKLSQTPIFGRHPWWPTLKAKIPQNSRIQFRYEFTHLSLTKRIIFNTSQILYHLLCMKPCEKKWILSISTAARFHPQVSHNDNTKIYHLGMTPPVWPAFLWFQTIHLWTVGREFKKKTQIWPN